MNILHHLTWKSMVANRTRTLVTVLGVLLSAALFCTVTTLAMSVRSYLIDLQIYHGGDYYVKCHQVSAEMAQTIRADEGLESIAEAKILGIVNLQDYESGMNSSLLNACNDSYFETMPVHLKEGRLPQNSGEILISSYWQNVLPEYGISTEIGDMVSFDVIPYVESVGAGLPHADPTTKRFTVVGILAEEFTYETFYSDSNIQMLYTYDDGVDDELYSDFYLKGITPYSSFQIADRYNGIVNEILLSYFGAARSKMDQYFLIGSVLAFIIIIMIGSSGLIYNAFSVSVSQRLNEYGILSGIGATEKQLRKSIQYEAWIFCLLGIPIGLLLGYGGTILAVAYVGKVIQGMIPISSPSVAITAKFNPIAIILASLISGLTVFMSAHNAIRTSKKFSPISSIRQNHEHSYSEKRKKNGDDFEKTTNISASMAGKYYDVNQTKFRRVVVSLVMSIVIFMLAATVAQRFEDFADAKIQEENYDFIVMHPGEDQALLTSATSHQSIIRKAGYTSISGQLVLSESDYSMEKLEADEIISKNNPISKRRQDIVVYYLDDDVLQEYLKENNIDPAPYLRSESPQALVCKKKLTIQNIQTTDGSYEQYNLGYFPISENITNITVFSPDVPIELRNYYAEKYSSDQIVISLSHMMDKNDKIVCDVQVSSLVGSGTEANLKVVGSHVLLVKTDEITNQSEYYEIVDGDVGQTPVAICTSNSFEISLGARIEEMPFGISNDTDPYSTLTVILPLSATDKKIRAVAVQTQDYLSTLNHLSTYTEENIVFSDCMAEEFQYRSTAQMIDLFSTAYLLFITAICAANVFNTFSASLVSRKRDFGILESIGMTQTQLRKMIIIECCKCGVRSILLGLPIGIMLCTLLSMVLTEQQDVAFGIPIKAILFCVLCVAITVGISMTYALKVIKEDSPIKSIHANTF